MNEAGLRTSCCTPTTEEDWLIFGYVHFKRTSANSGSGHRKIEISVVPARRLLASFLLRCSVFAEKSGQIYCRILAWYYLTNCPTACWPKLKDFVGHISCIFTFIPLRKLKVRRVGLIKCFRTKYICMTPTKKKPFCFKHFAYYIVGNGYIVRSFPPLMA
jgi:hypothetical protein